MDRAPTSQSGLTGIGGTPGAAAQRRPARVPWLSREALRERRDAFLERWGRTLTVLRAPRTRIEVYGDADVRATYRFFTARHPRIRVTATKRWGVALLQVPDSFDAYMARSKHLRRKVRHAQKIGYRHAVVEPGPWLEDVLAIHRSTPVRQGRRMLDRYVDGDEVRREFARIHEIHGVFDADGRLWAYATVQNLGTAYAFQKALGHADSLGDGVMYLLVSEVVRACVDARRATGQPAWLMYDTFWGASRGLAYFKEQVGFEPHTVDWVWVDDARRVRRDGRE